MLIGLLADKTVLYMSRIWWIIIGFIFLLLGYFTFIASPNLKTITVLTSFVALGYGTLACMFGTVLSILFGTRYFVFNNGALRLSGALGSIAFSYSQTALVELHFSKHECLDHLLCYREPFLLCLFSIVISCILVVYLFKNYPPDWLLNDFVLESDQVSIHDEEATSKLLKDN